MLVRYACCFHSLTDYDPDLQEGADSVGGQIGGDKEFPFSGVTSSGRVWKEVLDSDDRSVGARLWRHGTQRETEPRLTHTRQASYGVSQWVLRHHGLGGWFLLQ